MTHTPSAVQAWAIKSPVIILVVFLLFSGCTSTVMHDQTVQVINKHDDTSGQRTIVDQTGSVRIVTCEDCISTFYIWEGLQIGHVYSCDLIPNGMGEYRWVENCTEKVSVQQEERAG